MRIPEISEETRRRIRRVGLFLIAAGVVLYAAQVGREMYANYTEVEKARAAQEKARAEEAVRLWTASRRTEMPEGTIVRCDLLGVSAAV